MKKKKSVFSIATGALLIASLSFATGASAINDPGHGGGSISKPPKCNSQGYCPIAP